MSMKTKILMLVLACMLAVPAQADPPSPHPKYAKILCVLAGIPIKYCHRKKK